MQDCDQWIRAQNILHSISSPIPMSPTFAQMDVTPTIPPNTFFGHAPNTSFGLKVSDICCIYTSIYKSVVIHCWPNHVCFSFRVLR